MTIEVPSAATIPREQRMTRARRAALRGYLFISPWIIGFLAFSLIPMAASLWLSLTKYNIIQPPKYIGLENYRYAFQDDGQFWPSILRTLYFTAVSVPLGIAGSLLLAVLMNREMVGKAVFRTFFFLPTLTPIIATALLWSWLLHPEVGLFNYVLFKLGLPTIGWLSDSRTSMPSLIMISLWGSIGGNRMIIFLAGLQGVPEEQLEAAELDGAGRWDKFWNVTVPALSPVIFFNLVLGFIGSFQVFALSYVGTDGGPSWSTWFFMLHIVKQALTYFEMGYAAALSWVFFLFILVFTIIQIRLSSFWVFYAGEGR